jgi:hypothetical protein
MTAVRTDSVRHVARLVAVARLVSAAVAAPDGSVRPTTARRLPGGQVVTRPAALADMTTRAARGRTRRPSPLLPQAAAASSAVSVVGVWLAWCPTPRLNGERSCRRHCRTLPLRPSGKPSSRTPADGLPRPGVRPTEAVATGTGRRVGGRWWDATSAGGRGRAGWSTGRGAGRGHRSSPAG